MFRDAARLPNPVRAVSLAGIPLLIVGLVGVPAHAAEAPVGLGTAGSFAVLAGQSVTNTGASVVTGDIGVGPGTSVTGIPPLVQLDGALHVADAVANQAQADLTTAYNSAAGRSTVTDVTGSDLGGLTLTSGVVEHTSGMQLTGTLTLDAQGDPSSVFIFKAGSTLITAPNSTVSLINGASPCNVFWQVGSSTTLDTNTTFVGTVMSLTSATMNTGARLQGRMLARNGSVTLDTNVINRPDCAAPAPTTSPTPSPTVSPSATPTTTGSALSTPASPSSSTNGGNPSSSPTKSGSNSGQGGDSDNNGSNNNGSGTNGSGGDGGSSQVTGGSEGSPGSPGTPVVPVGHPETGLGGESEPGGSGWGVISLLAGLGLAAGALGWRRSRPVRLPRR